MAKEGSEDRGRNAEGPFDIPKEGWIDVTKRTIKEVKNDRVTYISAAVAFYAMLAIFPAIIAFVSIYGLIADPAVLERQLSSMTFLPDSARELLSSQLHSIVSTSGSALSWGLVLSLLGLLWTASAGVRALMQATNIAYDEQERRGFFKLRAVALLLTLGGLVLVAAMVAALAIVPAAAQLVDVGGANALEVLRWPLLVIAVAFALAVLYRYAPSREAPKWRWVSPGSLLATVVWLVASIGFSWYVSSFGKFNETYGALGGVIVLLMWFYISAIAIVVGAELDAEVERQTARDTTKGPDRPPELRGARVAV